MRWLRIKQITPIRDWVLPSPLQQAIQTQCPHLSTSKSVTTTNKIESFQQPWITKIKEETGLHTFFNKPSNRTKTSKIRVIRSTIWRTKIRCPSRTEMGGLCKVEEEVWQVWIKQTVHSLIWQVLMLGVGTCWLVEICTEICPFLRFCKKKLISSLVRIINICRGSDRIRLFTMCEQEVPANSKEVLLEWAQEILIQIRKLVICKVLPPIIREKCGIRRKLWFRKTPYHRPTIQDLLLKQQIPLIKMAEARCILWFPRRSDPSLRLLPQVTNAKMLWKISNRLPRL